MSGLTLAERHKAAYTAWAACPEKPKARKAALEAELAAAAAAVAAAKRAQMPAPTVDQAAMAAALVAIRKRQDQTEKDNTLMSALDRAAAMWHRAREWPRCGEGWGRYPDERAAEALLRANPEFAHEVCDE